MPTDPVPAHPKILHNCLPQTGRSCKKLYLPKGSRLLDKFGFPGMLSAAFLAMLYYSSSVYGQEQAQPHTTYVIITVDAETPSPANVGEFPFPEQLEAKIGSEGVGIFRMMDIADSFQFPITFFVDVLEYTKFGKDAIRDIVQTIDHHGHDVQLHTHPEWLGSRIYMNEYSLQEQIEIIKSGRELLTEWSGRSPVVHRTGTYAANEDTIEALGRNDIYFDSSWFYSNPFAHGLSGLSYPVNAVAERKGIVQFPVSVFRLGEWANFFKFKLPPIYRYKKVDIDSCNLQQLCSVLDQLAENDADVVTLFLHSFTFISRWDPDPQKRQADLADIGDFRETLRHISENSKIRVISAREFSELYSTGRIQLSHADFVPSVIEKVTLIEYFRKYIGITKANFLYFITSGVILLAIFFTLSRSIQSRRKNRP